MTLDTDIANLAHTTVPELAAHYEALFGTPPRSRNAAWLRKRIAFKLQENAFGGLSRTARAKIDELAFAIRLPIDKTNVAAPTKSPVLKTGTILHRVWHGQQIFVEVVDGGFVWNGTRYSSLSAVANAVTGSKWNGKLFFGLTERHR